MNVSIKATHIDLTEAIKQYAEEKVSALSKYLDATDAKVELERDRNHHSGEVFRAEVTVHAGGNQMMADATATDLYAAIDLVIPKIKEQLTKFKDKHETLERKGAREAKGLDLE